MYKVWLLCKVQFKEIFSITNSNKKSKIGFGIALLIIGLFFLSLSILYTIIIGSALNDINKINYLPSLFFSVTSIITLITTIYQVKGVIFGSSDYQLLLSFPVSNWQIVLSKIIMIYIYEFSFTFILMLPADIYYFILSPNSISFLITILSLFCIPILPLSVAIIIGFIISFFSERLPLKNVLQVLFTTAFIVLVLIFSFKIGQGNNEDIAELVNKLISQMEMIYPIMGIYTLGCINGDILYLLMYLAINLGALLLSLMLVGLFYMRLNNWIFTSKVHKRNVKKQLKKGNQFKAFFIKECSTYFNSPVYFLTTIVGGVLAIAFSILMVIEIKNNNLIFNLSEEIVIDLSKILKPYLSVIICAFVGLASLTSSSISMEGDCFWIIKSSPVIYRHYLGAKLVLNQLIIGGCALISSIIIICSMDLEIGELLMVLLNPQAFILFTGSIGLGVNLRHPKLTWSSEQAAVKNSSSTLFSMLSGLCLVVFLTLIIFFVSAFSSILSFALCMILFIGNGIIIFFSLIKDANKIIDNIHDNV